MSRTRAILGAALVVGALAAASPAFAQGNNVIRGKVYNEARRPVGNVLVVLKSAMGAPLDRAVTNESGEYVFSGVSSGIFAVSVDPGKPYNPATQQVQIFGGQTDGSGDPPPEIQRLDFYLTRSTPVTPPPPAEPLFVQDIPEEAEQEYGNAVRLLEEGEQKKGMQGLERAVGLFPEYYAAHDRLGREFMQQKKIAEAFGEFQKAYSINPNSASSTFGLGWALYQDGQFDHAYRALDLSRRLNSRIAPTQYYMGLVCYELKKDSEAIEAFRVYVELPGDETNPDAYLFLSSLHERQNQIAEALAAVEKYLEVAPPEKRTAKIRQLKSQLEQKLKD